MAKAEPLRLDTSNLDKNLREFTRSIHELTRVVEALNKNLVEVGRMMKDAEDGQDEPSV